MRVQGRIVKLDRGFPLAQVANGARYRCKHATAFVKGQRMRAVIGDRVVLDQPDDADVAQIVQILPRRNEFVRKDPAERTQPQVLAANFDVVVVAHPLAELNVRRLERELVLAHETGAAVVVALTKADLAESGESLRQARDLVRNIAADDVKVLVVSENDPASIEALRACIPPDAVAVLIGRSGVGKSSLVNLLAGSDVMATTPVREADGKGRHTTVSRTMIQVEGGGLVVDMPGVRGLGLWESEDGIAAAFPDIAELAAACRFRDCKHENEPGCAVIDAVESGAIPQERLDSYRSLMAENQAQHQRREEADRLRERKQPHHPRRRR